MFDDLGILAPDVGDESAIGGDPPAPVLDVPVSCIFINFG